MALLLRRRRIGQPPMFAMAPMLVGLWHIELVKEEEGGERKGNKGGAPPGGERLIGIWCGGPIHTSIYSELSVLGQIRSSELSKPCTVPAKHPAGSAGSAGSSIQLLPSRRLPVL